MQFKHTLDYYENNAEAFYKETVSVDFLETQKRFMSKLRDGANVLDFGCGSGRDTKYFIQNGFVVDAIDGSKNICKLAEEYTGIKVKNMLFHELNEVDKYDGIWACSSILHLPENALIDVMKKMIRSLKQDGIIYTSFKYGEFSGERNGRYFIDMTESKFEGLLNYLKDIEMEEHWLTSDVRPGRGEEKWLNLILRKIEQM